VSRSENDNDITPLIIDFGLSFPVISTITGRDIHEVRGTYDCLPPQMLMDPPSTLYTNKVDIWGFGMLALILFTGHDIYPDGTYCNENRPACFSFIQNTMRQGSLLHHILDIIRKHKLCPITASEEKLLAAFISSALSFKPEYRPSARRLLENPLFSHMTNHPEHPNLCKTLTPEWPPEKHISPKYMEKLRFGALEIARLFLGFRVPIEGTDLFSTSGDIGLGIHIFYWTVDLMYLYFTHPTVDVNTMTDDIFGAYIVAFVSMMQSVDGFFLPSDLTDVFINLLSHVPARGVITHEMIEAIKPGIAVTLDGRIWRRFLYESIRTKKDLNKSYHILFNPEEYLSYKPNPIDPLNEESPAFWDTTSIMSIQLPK
jgi:hypothetical protein